MAGSKLMSKSTLILVVIMIAGVSSAGIRTLLWDDPWCHKFCSDGTCCLECSFRCYMDKYGKCHPVSDFCNTWDNCTGKCLTCYDGYGDPVNGVCPSSVPAPTVDDHCAQYVYVGCDKVCTKCECGYYLNCDNKCIALPPYCTAADKYGKCTSCVSYYHVECGKCVPNC